VSTLDFQGWNLTINTYSQPGAKELVDFLAGSWPVGFDAMEKLIEEKGGSGEAIES